MFDTKVAEKLLRTALMTVKDQIGITKEDIYNNVEAVVIQSIERDREEFLEPLQKFKQSLEKTFPQFEFHGRVKSLSSILAKYMQDRTLADAFGFCVKTNTKEECYLFLDWLRDHFRIRDLEDRIENPKSNGYMDIKVVIVYEDILVEFIIQDVVMYDNAHNIQKHELAYPWKYSEAILSLPEEYKQKNF